MILKYEYVINNIIREMTSALREGGGVGHGGAEQMDFGCTVTPSRRTINETIRAIINL